MHVRGGRVQGNRTAGALEHWAIAEAVLFLLLSAFAPQSSFNASAATRKPGPKLPESPNPPIYTWIGNTPEWDRKLHVAGYRMGCDTGDPQGCVGDASQAVAEEGLRQIFLSMAMDPQRTLSDAREYSRLSVSHPFIAEVGFDDFEDRYEGLFEQAGFDAPSWLRNVVRAVKA